MSVARAQREIDSAEFSEWLAYDQIDPIGQQREDLRAGIIAATVANSSGNSKHQFKPEEFMPRFGEPPKRQTAEEQMAILGMIAGVVEG